MLLEGDLFQDASQHKNEKTGRFLTFCSKARKVGDKKVSF